MIKVSNLTKKYGNRIALDNISFEVNKGDIVGFLGPNGAGKSTTMNILTGYISSTDGSVEIDGIDILNDPINAKKKIGYLPETPPLYMDMKVREYLNFVFDLKKVKLNISKKSHIDEICELVKISDVTDRIIKNLSKGYKQRVGLAQALIGNPELLILDEPTVGLDPKQIIEIRNLIKKLGESHTVILSSHILSEIQAVCDRVIIINNGNIAANEKTNDLSRAISSDQKISLDFVGDSKKVFDLISELEDVEKIEILDSDDCELCSFVIYLKSEIDARKDISKLVTDSGSTVVGLKYINLSLEEAFLRLTDVTSDIDDIDFGLDLDDEDDEDHFKNKRESSIRSIFEDDFENIDKGDNE